MTITRHETMIVLPTERPWTIYCAYEHKVQMTADAPPETIYVGVCRLTDVYRMGDGNRNSEWQGIFARGGQVLIRIFATSTDRHELTMLATQHMRSLPNIPRCNLRGVKTRGRGRAVWCSNGEVYPNQIDASVRTGVPQSQISRVVNGYAPTAHGLVFRLAKPSEVTG